MRANTYFDYVAGASAAFKDDRIPQPHDHYHSELRYKVCFSRTNSYQYH